MFGVMVLSLFCFDESRPQAHGRVGLHRVDLRAFVAQFGQQLARVLAQRRRMQAHAQALAAERDREQRRLAPSAGALAVGQADVRQAAGGQQVRSSYRSSGRGSARTAGRAPRRSRPVRRRRTVGQAFAQVASSVGRRRTRSLLVAQGRVGLQVGEAQRVAERPSTARRSPRPGRSARRPSR
jgi:hypothetical protein